MNADTFPYDVFLSPSAQDQAVVRAPSLSASNGKRAGVRCRSPLRQDGLKVCFDEWVLKPGDRIPAKIEAGSLNFGFRISDFGFAQPGLSAHAFGSDWAPLEAGTFRFLDPLNQERRFMPLRLDGIRPTRFETCGCPRHQRPF